jgi:hypothetical protein
MYRNYSNLIAGFLLLAKQLKALLYPAYAKQIICFILLMRFDVFLEKILGK